MWTDVFAVCAIHSYKVPPAATGMQINNKSVIGLARVICPVGKLVRGKQQLSASFDLYGFSTPSYTYRFLEVQNGPWGIFWGCFMWS